jgi:hypothetical protein
MARVSKLVCSAMRAAIMSKIPRARMRPKDFSRSRNFGLGNLSMSAARMDYRGR